MAKPIVKWVGGKRGILDKLVAAMPQEYGSYYEPFAGGAALFLALSPLDGHKAFISDLNGDLVNLYSVVQKKPVALMSALDSMADKHCEDYYYEVRSWHDLEDPVERAARFLFINKTGYNGLIRYNSKGQINTPWGHKKNPVSLYVEEDIRAAAQAFKGASVRCRSYTMCRPKAGDFVYLDPPYDSTYNGYDKDGFGVKGQCSLAEWCHVLDGRGVKFMLSNSDTPLINELYQDFHVAKITAPRAVSCKADGRKPVQEVLVTNYER